MNKIEYELKKNDENRLYIEIPKKVSAEDKFFVYEYTRYLIADLFIQNEKLNKLKPSTLDNLLIAFNVITTICNEMSKLLTTSKDAVDGLLDELNIETTEDNNTDE